MAYVEWSHMFIKGLTDVKNMLEITVFDHRTRVIPVASSWSLLPANCNIHASYLLANSIFMMREWTHTIMRCADATKAHEALALVFSRDIKIR